MALVPVGMAPRQMRMNRCIFSSIVSFDACITYKSPCSPDAYYDDGWFICNEHLVKRFKMSKMVLPIYDEDDNQFKMTIARHLVGHAEDKPLKRILVPTSANYQEVFNLNSMMQAEQLIFHMIYNNNNAVNEICNNLRVTEGFANNTQHIIYDVYSNTKSILDMTDPQTFCSRVSKDELRFFGSTSANEQNITPADTYFNQFSGFLQNLIRRAVAPEIIQIDKEELRLRNCATCIINAEGLIASVPSGVELYNPLRRNDIAAVRNQPNRLQIRNVLKFEGDTRELDRTLSGYEEYCTSVPLFLGIQLINAENNTLNRTLNANARLAPTTEEPMV
ncbi:vp39 [Palpita vitrealis nucleopolyhedrovirus]|uniref:Vp39 n=1 Tax=Palpita vitrealis nucleopolyhedrovirus TaxID=2951960 RepID=A0AAE9RYY6_9ABAC|nr:vp39 [Palpita vitrealis nucleopolyhedrovirus]